MRKHFLVFGSPQIEAAEIDEVTDSLRSGWLGRGPKVKQFERDFATYKGEQNAVAVNSCTAALHLSILASGLGPGDEIITTAMTFCSTVNAVIHAGATPVLADIDPDTQNIDPTCVVEKITPRTKAILPVHFAGRPCNMDALCAIAKSHGLKLIEDCAHAIETEIHGQQAGTFGDFGCFSFYATKNVAIGEGGMILTRHAEDAARLRVLALHGLSRDAWDRSADDGYEHYQVLECGFKYNMTDLQAAIGLHQLARVETNWRQRKKIWSRYSAAFDGLPVRLPAPIAPETRHAYHLFTILVDEARTGISRDAFLSAMTARNIGVGVHYLSIPEHPYYQKRYGWKPEHYPNAMRIGRQTVSLPLSPKLTTNDVRDVILAVKDITSGL